MRWRDDAACRWLSTKIFFPKDAREPDAYESARAICATCTVREQCLDLVINADPADDKWGMFGGLTPHERRQLRQTRRP